MIISHVKIITFQLSLFKIIKIIAFQLSLFNYRFSVKIIAFQNYQNYRFSKLSLFNYAALYIINRKIHGCLEIPDLFLVLISCSTLELKYLWYFRAPMYYSLFNLKFVTSPEPRSLKIILTNIQHPLFLWFTFSQESTRTTRRRR